MRASLFYAAAGTLAATALPFFKLRQNRIVAGDPVFLLSLAPGLALLIAALWIVGAAASSRRGPLCDRAALLAPLLAAAGALMSAGFVAQRLVGSNPFARLSLSTGFWATILLSYASFVAVAGRSGSSRAFVRAAAAGIFGLLTFLLVSGFLDGLSVLREWNTQRPSFLAEVGRHVTLSGASVAAGGIIGVVVGAASLRNKVVRKAGFFILNIVQTMPSLALFGLLILPLSALADRFPALKEWGVGGIGPTPALIALSFYAMLPVARNTYVALEGIPPAARDAGRGMGMGRAQLLVRVEAPLALPVVLAGLRTAAVQAVGNTVVAALIGAGGLGIFIFQGLGQYAADMILLGTIPVIAMALAVDSVFGVLVRLLTPKPLRGGAA